jgi:hypothetical protein
MVAVVVFFDINISFDCGVAGILISARIRDEHQASGAAATSLLVSSLTTSS